MERKNIAYSAIICGRQNLLITNGLMQTKTTMDGLDNQDLFMLLMFYTGCLFKVGLRRLRAHKHTITVSNASQVHVIVNKCMLYVVHGSRQSIRGLTIGSEAIPEGHELCLHISHGFMVGCPSLPQETINLINENNSGLELVSETKYSSHCHSNNIPTSVYSIHIQKKRIQLASILN